MLGHAYMKVTIYLITVYVQQGVYHVYGDPDFNGDEKQNGAKDIQPNSAVAINYYTWTGFVIGFLFLIVILCLVVSWIYSCRRRSRARQQTEALRNQPKVFVLNPPSYISQDPPEYSAPDFFKINKEALKKMKKSKKKRNKTPDLQSPPRQQPPLYQESNNNSQTNIITPCSCEVDQLSPPPPYEATEIGSNLDDDAAADTMEDNNTLEVTTL